jgi:hypothetical protein
VTDALVISDPLRVPVTAQRLQDGRIIIRTPGKPMIIFSVSEIDRLASFAHQPRIQRYPKRPPEA